MNIHPNDFVLEIGSGHNPKTRSNVLCDKFIEQDEQRGGTLVADRPTVAADGQHLPFTDQAFDYVICSHVLEHVEAPEKLLTELMRVAKRGYIETPSEIAEKLYGWPYHQWIVNLVNGRLTLQPNNHTSPFGKLFHTLAAKDKQWKRFHIAHHNLFLVQYEWEQTIDYEILPHQKALLDLECPGTLEILLASDGNPLGQNQWLLLLKNAIPRGIVSRAKSVWAKGNQNRPQKTLQEILVCPQCKGEVAWLTEALHCHSCDRHYPILNGIPRFT